MCLGSELLERFGVDSARAAAEAAANAWTGSSRVPRIRISIAKTKQFDPRRLSNCIHLAEDWTTGGNELALTYTASTEEGTVRYADIVVNGAHPFGMVNPSQPDDHFDLQAVLTHEMGHLLGLAENPYNEEATMNPDIGPGETFQRVLTEDDRQGARAAYAETSPVYPGCAVTPFGGRMFYPWLIPMALAVVGIRRREAARSTEAQN